MRLNARARVLVQEMCSAADQLRIRAVPVGGALVLDCGVETEGTLDAGLWMARAATADLADVALRDGTVCVASDQPVLACLGSQYAGWKVEVPGYFAIASGPMRAMRRNEKVYEMISEQEESEVAVGLLEASRLPDALVVDVIAKALRLSTDRLALLAAPAASLAGTVQITARGLETALHKLHEIGGDLGIVRAGRSSVPLPAVGRTEIEAIGLTNDAILYGGQVTLEVDCSDSYLEEIGPRLPSSASPDHGVPFAKLFERQGGDFFGIDPLLFSPARVELINRRTGTLRVFGQLRPDLLTPRPASCDLPS